MKKISRFFTIVLMFTAAACAGCSSESDTTQHPLFDGTELISITSMADPITWSMPDVSYKYVVVGIFSGTEPTVTDGQVTGIVAGTRTGLPFYTDGSVPRDQIYTYNPSTKDFNTGSLFTVTSGQYVAVWAFDADYNLVASSPGDDTL